MLILTDFPRFPQRWQVANTEGQTRTTLTGASLKDLFKLIPDIRGADLLLVHESSSRLFWLVLLFWIVPFLRKPIVSVDIILLKPSTIRQRIGAWLKKMILHRVDHFIHYFKDLKGYEEFYGI